MNGGRTSCGIFLSALLWALPVLSWADGALSNKTCLECHADAELRTERNGHAVSLYTDPTVFANSAHADIACILCHVDIVGVPHTKNLVKGGAQSPLYRTNIPALCGKCHPDIAKIYAESIHGKALLEGVEDVPVCTDCHGAHAIASSTDPVSKVAPKNIPKTCGVCHEEARLAEKYGLPTRRFSTYLDSYHGVANRYGETTVANCATCHGVHDIRPSSDPMSSIHASNLGKTCGTCHPGAAANLAGLKIHVEAENSKGIYWVRQFYTYFTGLLVVGFLIHITVDIIGFLRRRRLT